MRVDSLKQGQSFVDCSGMGWIYTGEKHNGAYWCISDDLKKDCFSGCAEVRACYSFDDEAEARVESMMLHGTEG